MSIISNSIYPTLLLNLHYSGGPRKHMLLQMIEYYVQKQLGLSAPLEAFGWPQAKYDKLVEYSVDALEDTIIPILDEYIPNRKIELLPFILSLATWKTGAREEALSSAITGHEHMIDQDLSEPPRWKDTIPEPLHPDAVI